MCPSKPLSTLGSSGPSGHRCREPAAPWVQQEADWRIFLLGERACHSGAHC